MNRLILKILKPVLKKPYLTLNRKYFSIPKKIEAIEKNQEKWFVLYYKNFFNNLDQKNSFKIHEYKVYSQHGEDGIILYIFSNIGIKNKTFVEIGIDDGRECNTANLSINFGWKGLLLEKVKENIIGARSFYKSRLGSGYKRLKIVQRTVTAENINETLKENGMEGEIDLLSIDIDGNDYWIWKTLKVIKPRVVVMEYNGVFGQEKSITIKYDPNFFRFDKHSRGIYFGASIKAMDKLAKRKGYRLVCCDSSGTNAFFIRKDIADRKFTELSISEAYYQSYDAKANLPTDKLFTEVKEYPFKEV